MQDGCWVQHTVAQGELPFGQKCTFDHNQEVAPYNFSTAYAWIGMISRSNPTRDGRVIRTQQYNYFQSLNLQQQNDFCYLGELTIHHTTMAVRQIMTFNSLNFHNL